MSLYKRLKFKMKLCYTEWRYDLRTGQLLHDAIYKTIVQRQRLAQHELSKFMTTPYNDQHQLFTTVRSKALDKERQKTRREKKEQVAR